MSTIEFNNRFNEFTNILQAFAYNLTKDFEESRDLFQETAYRALKNRDKFLPGTNFKAWLFTIMKNIFINNYRRKVKANTIIDTTDNQFYINSGKKTIVNQAETNIMMKELSGMIEKLDDSIKIPFERHYAGFKYQEIADEMGLPLGTVKSRIFFARKELKDMLYKKYGMTENSRN
ncbi:MAG TPA: RNA polymerase sigma factor [Saprospiraceae bacterium]|nr:RNA polymerase sigma factor [Saprospiraceae bacterium]